MRALIRKSLRDLWLMRGQALAIALVMACGVATFTMSMSTRSSLQAALDRYYATRALADVFASVKRAPEALAARIADLPGVARVQTRVVVDVNLDIPGEPDAVTGRLVSLPPDPAEGLNRLTLRDGRWPEPGRRGEAVASEAFATARRLRPGDRLAAVINGRREDLRITGVALSPEYVYEIRPGAMFPDNERFGVMWMERRALAAAAGLEGAFNDVSLAAHPGAPVREILDRLDRLLEPHGSTGAFPRADQTSVKMTSDEISQMRSMAFIPPSIFLSVAAFLLNVVLTRLIGTQREQIAMLKSFGYSGAGVAAHYLWMVGGIVFSAMLIGTAAGAWLGGDMTRMYMKFFRIPDYSYRLSPLLPLGSAGLCLLAALAGVLGAVWRAARLPPAEAMRPEAPSDHGPSIAERLGFARFLGVPARMVFRNLERRPLRSLFAVIGVALATAVLVLGSFVRGTIDYVMDVQFQGSQRQDYTVTLVEPAGDEAFSTLLHLPGVLRAEPFRAAPVRIRAGHRERRLGLTGLEPGRDLYPLLDMELRPARLAPGALLISETLGKALGVRPGDRVRVEVLSGRRRVLELPVGGFLRDFAGIAAYMDRAELGRLLGEPETWSGAFVKVDAARDAAFTRAIKETPRIAAVSSTRAAIGSFRKTFAENILRMRFFNVMFATIIAFGVVYNTARIALGERSRELATLRVIGFTRGEISTILLGEVGALVFTGILPGFGLGYGFAALATWFLATESQRFPLVVAHDTFAFSATVVLLAATLSSLVVRRGLDHLNLVSVLKARE
ncbi:MAG: FtsX-like permease family protein [Kiritimatiellia bacterium]